jgi:hypothetical protein
LQAVFQHRRLHAVPAMASVFDRLLRQAEQPVQIYKAKGQIGDASRFAIFVRDAAFADLVAN